MLTATRRRSRAEMESLKASLVAIVNEEDTWTVRQIFYQAVSRQLIAKTEGEYKATIVRLLGALRLEGRISFDKISDNTRWMRRPTVHRNLGDALRRMQRDYRRDFWLDQDCYVEIWLEKDALASVVYDATAPWGVPLMVTRGYGSLSYLHDAAEVIASQKKPAWIYYLGDHDPSGLDIPRTTEARLRQFAPEAEIHFQRIAVTREQIAEHNLPTRPTKTTDSRAAKFEGESVEVDALPPRVLRALVSDAIEQHVDDRTLRQTQRIEEAEKDTLTRFLAAFPGRSRQFREEEE